MQHRQPLVPARLVRRYKRFLVDAVLDDGTLVTAHSNNTGSLLGCLEEGARVWLAPAENPNRKLAYTFTLVQVGRRWVCADTSLAVPMVERWIRRGAEPSLAGYERALREVPYGASSRIDLLLSRGGRAADSSAGRRGRAFVADERVYVEVKSTTLVVREGGARAAAFPDAVTERGQKHLRELAGVVAEGHRAAMVYCVQRGDADYFRPAREIDPAYAEALGEAVAAGVEVYAVAARVGPRSLALHRRLEVRLDP